MPGRKHAAIAAHLAYLARVLGTSTTAGSWVVLADRACEQISSHDEFLAAVLAPQIADREANRCAISAGGIRSPRVKARKH